MLGIRTQDHRIIDTNESTELWRHPTEQPNIALKVRYAVKAMPPNSALKLGLIEKNVFLNMSQFRPFHTSNQKEI